MADISGNSSVFISYAREDDEIFVQRLYRDLTASGLYVWWDREAMESRGRTFLQELRDAIEEVDRVLFVVGPQAVVSHYCGVELEHALLFGKGIIPILRLGDYSLLPPQLAKLDCPDFREERVYSKALIELLGKLSEPVAALGPLRNLIPALPPHFVPRQEEFKGLTERVLADVQRPIVITPATQLTGLSGMGGIGKSSLAAAFARATDTRRAFPDGIIWVTLGQGAESLSVMRRVGLAFEDSPTKYATFETAQTALPVLLADKVCLIILDDMWQAEQANHLRDALGPRCRVLITTRDSSTLSSLGALEYPLGVLNHGQSLNLLTEWVGQPEAALPSQARDLVNECGGLPLALAMIGAMLRGKPERWANVLHRLRHADLDKIRSQFPGYPYPTLLRAIQVGVEALEPALQDRYWALAVFPKSTPIAEAALYTYWAPDGLDQYDVQDMVDALVDRSLLIRDKEGRLTLHDLLFDYLRAQVRDLVGLNKRLLDAYRSICGGGWATGPNDGYFFEHLIYHLIAAEERSEVEATLCDLGFIEAKCAVGLTYDLVRDYVRAREAFKEANYAIDTFAEFVRRQSHELFRSPAAAFQLAANEPETSVVHQAAMSRWRNGQETRVWLRRLDKRQQPAFTLVYAGHRSGGEGGGGSSNWITCVRFSPDGNSVASSAYNGSVHVWDASTGELRRSLTADGRPATSCAWAPDNRRIVVTYSGELLVWDVELGRPLMALASPSLEDISTCAWSPDGARIAGAGRGSDSRGELAIWNVNTGLVEGHFLGHSQEVVHCAFSPESDRLLSCTGGFMEDNDLILWDVKTQSELVRYAAAGREITSCAFLSDTGRVAFTEMTSALEGELVVRDGYLEQEYCRVAVPSPTCISYAHRENIIAVGSRDHKTYLFSGASGGLRITLEGHGSWVETCDFDAHSATLVTGSRDCTVRAWQAMSQDIIQTETERRHLMGISCGAFSDDSMLFVSGSESDEHYQPCGSVVLWDARTGDNLAALLNAENSILQCAFVPGGHRIVVSTDGGYFAEPMLCMLNTQPSESLRHIHEYVETWTIEKTAGLLCKLHWGEGEVLRIDTWDTIFRFSGAGGCLLDAQRQIIVTADQTDVAEPGNTVILVDMQDGRQQLQPSLRTPLTSLTWSPDKRFVLAFSEGQITDSQLRNEVTCWDLENDDELVLHLESRHYRVASFLDNHVAVSADYDILLYELPSGRLVGSFAGHEFFVTGCAHAPGHPWIISGSLDMSLRLWSVETQECIARFSLDGRSTFLAVSPDGSRIAAGDELGNLYLLAIMEAKHP